MRITGQKGANTPKFVPPRWGRSVAGWTLASNWGSPISVAELPKLADVRQSVIGTSGHENQGDPPNRNLRNGSNPQFSVPPAYYPRGPKDRKNSFSEIRIASKKPFPHARKNHSRLNCFHNLVPKFHSLHPSANLGLEVPGSCYCPAARVLGVMP